MALSITLNVALSIAVHFQLRSIILLLCALNTVVVTATLVTAVIVMELHAESSRDNKQWWKSSMLVCALKDDNSVCSVCALCASVCALRASVCALCASVCALCASVCALRASVCALGASVCALGASTFERPFIGCIHRR